MQQTKRKSHHWGLLASLCMLMSFASISTDLYLPAMPAIGQELRALHGMLEWTVTGYLIGFSFGQFLWGPIGDRYGRRLPVFIGISFFIFGSAGCALSTEMNAMIFWRLIQSIGSCACVVLSRAMVRDLYSGYKAAQMMSILMTIMAAAPLVGPWVGGHILTVAGWRSIFWVLVILGSVSWVFLYFMPETLPRNKRHHYSLKDTFKNYIHILKVPRIIRFICLGGFYYGGIYAFIAGSPVAYIDYYGLSPQNYGFIFGVSILGVMLSNVINSKYIKQVGGEAMMRFGAMGAAIAGLLLLVSSQTDLFGLIGLVVPLVVFASMNGFIVANSLAGAMEDYSQSAGAISALVGGLHYGFAMLGTLFVGLYTDGTPSAMCVVMLIAGLLTLATAFSPFGRRQQSLKCHKFR